jgi:histidinol-phosphate aminotransferase
MIRPVDPVSLIRPEFRRLPAYHLDLEPCRHKLDQNEAPWDLPRRMKLAVTEGLMAADWARYPDFHSDDLRRDLGRLHAWPWEGILVGNGSNELLSTALAALVAPGTEVIGAEPSFGLYRMFVMRSGGVPRFLLRPDLRRPALMMDEIEAEVERNPRRPVLLCSPNNPTGDALPPEWVAALLERLEGPLLLDNAYGEFSRHDYRPLLARYPHLILFRTFSKAWSLAGLRLGYLLARPALVAELIKVKLPYTTWATPRCWPAAPCWRRRKKPGGACGCSSRAGRSGRACWPRRASRSFPRKPTSSSSAATARTRPGRCGTASRRAASASATSATTPASPTACGSR